MLKRVNVLKTVSEYTPFWDYVNLAHYHTIPDKMYQFATHTPANIDTKCISVELDVDNLMAISLDSYYLTNGHVRHIENFMQLNYGIGNVIENETETYFNVDDYRLGIFAVSSSILERLLNNEFYEEFVYFIENGMPAPKDLNKLAKEKLMKFEGETLTDFLNYHLTKYKGNIRKFIKNLIELTNDSWKEDTAINILKRQTFTIWKEEAKKKYNLKESDFEENINSKNQDLKMNKNYPLIKPVQTENYPFWVYNNFAYLFDDYKNSPEGKKPFCGDGEIKMANNPPFLLANESIKTGLMYIEDVFFDWIIENYYGRNINIKYKGKWDYSEFAINCFSSDFDISETDNIFLDSPYEVDKVIIPKRNYIVHSIEVFDNEYSKSYPDSQQLDLLVKEYLENIVTKWTNKNIFDMGGMSGVDISPNRLYHFFDYHFEEYQGDMHDFVNHSIELVEGLWNVESVKNANRQKCFDFWVEDKIVKNNLDRSKLGLEPIATLESTQPIKKGILETELVKESNSIDDTLIIIPLIELVETNVPVFWSYYNYAQLYKRHATRYIENGTTYYRHNENRIGGSIQSLGIKYLNSLKLNIVESFPYDCDNNVELINTGNGYLIGFFSAQHEIVKTQVGDINYYDGNISERIDKIQIQDFERQNLYPNPEHLDLVVKYYLKIIDYKPSANELYLQETNDRGHFTNFNKVFSFFDYHFNKYEGEPEGFIKHSIKLTSEVWKKDNLANRGRRNKFNEWVEYEINKHDLDVEKINPDKVEKNKIDSKTSLPFSLIELNSQSPNGNLFDYVDSELYSFLNGNLFKYNGSVYEYLKNIIDLTNKNWHESLIDINRKSTFKEWLNSTIESNHLDRLKLGLEPVTTPKPPQEQDNNDVQNTAKPTKKEILLYYEYTEWGKNFKIKTQMFLEISRLFNFSPKSLKTAENDLANKRKIYLSDFNNVARLTALLEGNENALKRLNEDLVQHKIV